MNSALLRYIQQRVISFGNFNARIEFGMFSVVVHSSACLMHASWRALLWNCFMLPLQLVLAVIV